MTKTLPLVIVTPEKSTLEDHVDSITLPAFEGQLGILPGHAPLLAQLQPGPVLIRKGDTVQTLAVSGGFVEVHEGRVAIFAETAEMAEEINEQRARQALERAREEIHQVKGHEEDLSQARASMERALARLKVLDGLRRKMPRS
ncbi:MAG TPA: F0F1 ATP synthase subunit epsilon [Elusimicrobiota bacterium]|nr:F0F1 ATP synthase subunit epsilon [Elusimicrobiota bacterium]